MKGHPAPFELVKLDADKVPQREIARRLGKSLYWVRKTLDQHELYCFGRLARHLPKKSS